MHPFLCGHFMPRRQALNSALYINAAEFFQASQGLCQICLSEIYRTGLPILRTHKPGRQKSCKYLHFLGLMFVKDKKKSGSHFLIISLLYFKQICQVTIQISIRSHLRESFTSQNKLSFFNK